MKLQLFFALTAGLLLTIVPGPCVAQKVADNLEGTWSIVSLEINGQPVDVSKLQAARLTVKGDGYSFRLDDTRLEFTHKLNSSQRPKTLDMTYIEGEHQGKTLHAIYELVNDELRICRHVDPNRERPSVFATQPDSGLMLIVWKRQ